MLRGKTGEARTGDKRRERERDVGCGCVCGRAERRANIRPTSDPISTKAEAIIVHVAYRSEL